MTGIPSSPPAERISAKSICATKLKAMAVPHVPRSGCQGYRPVSTAKEPRREDRACRRGGSLLSGRLRPLRQDQVRGSWRVARRLPIEETTLRAQSERARLPTLCVLSTSAAFHGARRADIHAELLPPNGGSQAAERPLLCRFSDACMTAPSTRADGRRPKSAKARNRGRRIAAGASGLWGISLEGHGHDG